MSGAKYDSAMLALLRLERDRLGRLLEAIDYAILQIVKDRGGPTTPAETDEKYSKPIPEISTPTVHHVINAPSDDTPLRTPHPTHGLAKKTPERVELLRRLWITPGKSRADIVAELNTLPGGEIDPKQLTAYVMLWGIAASAKPEQAVSTLPSLPTQMDPVQAPIAAVQIIAPAPPQPKVISRPLAAPPVLTTAPAARETVGGLAAAMSSKPVLADAATIMSWAAVRGITGKLDLERINAKRRQHQLPPFELEPIRHGQ